MNESESIFRNEALTYKENSFIGDFTVSPPSILPFTLWCSFFIFLLIVFILLLSYTQRIPIKGHVIYKPAASEVISNYDGVVKKLYVEQNNKVKKGDVIATISRDTFYSNGSVNEKLLEISKSQILELEKQKDILLKEADNENENLIKMIEKKRKK
ncbi:biotin/lipoyl-binding protein [Providencia manganoxydans]|uniref:biotin/lipoyl-binding protein n=1 Tax=Providencia manganoxydans TaxID=2923283 RepID=UPI0032D9B348